MLIALRAISSFTKFSIVPLPAVTLQFCQPVAAGEQLLTDNLKRLFANFGLCLSYTVYKSKSEHRRI